MEARQADAAGYISPPWAGTFIESSSGGPLRVRSRVFPFFFGRAFIEALSPRRETFRHADFPSYLEGLSLRRRRAWRSGAQCNYFLTIL